MTKKLRVGLVGHHEAFGAGAVFALTQLAQCDKGFYSCDDLLLQLMQHELQKQ